MLPQEPSTSAVAEHPNREPIGYLTSPWYSPELEINIALGHVPVTQDPWRAVRRLICVEETYP